MFSPKESVHNKSEPLKSSSDGTNVYKFKRGAQRNILNLNPEELQKGTRIFKALHSNEFKGPSIEYIEKEVAEGPEIKPFYADGQGNIYDKKYHLIEHPPLHIKIFSSIPEPTEYTNFFDYEQALFDWKVAVEDIVGQLHLPDIVGHCYSRPRVTAQLKELILAAKEELQSSQLKLAEVRERTGSIEEDKDDIDDESSSQSRGRSSEAPTVVMLDEDPWDALLLPEEPDPEQYKTFEEYEEAMKRWACICNASSTRMLPPHATQLERMIPIQSQATISQARASRKVRAKDKWAAGSITVDILGISAPYMVCQSWHMDSPFFDDTIETRRRTMRRQRRKTTTTYTPIIIDGNHQDDIPSSTAGEEGDSTLIIGGGGGGGGGNSVGVGSDTSSVSLSSISSTTSDISSSEGGTSSSSSSSSGVLILAPEVAINSKEGKRVSTAVNHAIARALLDRIGFHKNYGAFNPPLLPILHGTFEKSLTSTTLAGTTSKYSRHKALRRTDLTEETKESCYDCPEEVNGRTVEFNIPQFEINVDKTRLSHDKEYIKELQIKVRSMNSHCRFDKLNSWYFPATGNATHTAHLKQILSIIISNKGSTFTFEQIHEILRVPIFLDRFQSSIDNNTVSHIVDEDGLPRTIRDIFIRSMGTENVGSLLRLLHAHSNNILFHAKLSYLIDLLLQDNRGKLVVDHFINRKDLEYLSLLAYAITFFNEIPLDLYPYKPWVLRGHGVSGKSEEIMTGILMIYYLGCVYDVVEPRSYVYISVGPKYFSTSIENIVTQVVKDIKEYPEFLNRELIGGLGHRSSTHASLYTFLTLHMMVNPVLKSILLEQGDIIDQVIAIASSRFSHTQFAVARVLSVVSEDDEWRLQFYSRYDKSFEQLLEDTLQVEEHRLSTRTHVILDTIIRDLRLLYPKRDHSSPIDFLLQGDSFFLLYDAIHISSTGGGSGGGGGGRCGGNSISHTTGAYARLLSEMARTAYHCKLIECKENPSSPHSGLNIHTNPRVYRDMLDLVDNIPNTSPHAYTVKRYLLRTVRQLLKIKEAFPLLMKSLQFNKLTKFCKDGTSQEFNKEAWKLFYQLLKYHGNTVEPFLGNQVMGYFMDPITTVSANVVIQNSLHYLNKVFRMLDTAQGRYNAGLPVHTSRGDDQASILKGMTKDLKHFSNWFCVRRMFIKIHMIYKRFVENEDEEANYPGLPFTELVKLCETINESPSCEKIRKDTIKHPDYGTSFSYIINMMAKDRVPSHENLPGRGGGESLHHASPHTRSSHHAASPKLPNHHTRAHHSPATRPANKASPASRKDPKPHHTSSSVPQKKKSKFKKFKLGSKKKDKVKTSKTRGY